MSFKDVLGDHKGRVLGFYVLLLFCAWCLQVEERHREFIASVVAESRG